MEVRHLTRIEARESPHGTQPPWVQLECGDVPAFGQNRQTSDRNCTPVMPTRAVRGTLEPVAYRVHPEMLISPQHEQTTFPFREVTRQS